MRHKLQIMLTLKLYSFIDFFLIISINLLKIYRFQKLIFRFYNNIDFQQLFSTKHNSLKKAGVFQTCTATFYASLNFEDTICTIDLKEGEIFSSEKADPAWRPCFEHFQSFSVDGTFCKAQFQTYYSSYVFKTGRYALTSTQYRLVAIKLYDTSSEVLLISRASFRSNPQIGEFYHVCSNAEVDRAAHLADSTHKDALGTVFIGGKKALYNYGMKKGESSWLKQSWCCLNEKVELSSEIMAAESAGEFCRALEREEAFESRGKTIVYRFPRRVCTRGDIATHFLNYRRQPPRCVVEMAPGDYAFVEEGGGVYRGGRVGRGSVGGVCCCDGDCFPLGYFCASDGDCCTRNCVDFVCKGFLFCTYFFVFLSFTFIFFQYFLSY